MFCASQDVDQQTEITLPKEEEKLLDCTFGFSFVPVFHFHGETARRFQLFYKVTQDHQKYRWLIQQVYNLYWLFVPLTCTYDCSKLQVHKKSI